MKEKSKNRIEVIAPPPAPVAQPKPRTLEYVVFIVEGGIGKNVLATVPLKGIKAKYPDKKIVVVASWPDVFRFHPDVYRFYQMGNSPFVFDDYIKDGKGIVLKAEPYCNTDYVNPPEKTKHITEIWCDMLGVPYPDSKTQPYMFFDKNELAWGEQFIRSKGKPVMLIQWQGGMNNPAGPVIGQNPRTLPPETVAQLAQKFGNKYHVISVQNKEQPRVNGIDVTDMNVRSSWMLIPYASVIISIDSMVQHVAAAFNKTSIVCWAGTNPELLGYPVHINLRKRVCPTPECHRPNTYLFDQDATQNIWRCPHGEVCRTYTLDDIVPHIQKIESMVKK